jgi:ubiquinone/menaquinone biosynthesis C-methylase UbiE
MNRILSLFILLASCVQPTPPANKQPNKEEPRGYEQRAATPDGTGKFYMGREIAQVMGYQGAAWLDRDERTVEEKPDEVVSAMNLQPTDTVVDLGAGTGYFTFRVSQKVPQGKVLAVDVQPEMIKLLEDNKKAKGITNVEAILGTETDPKLPARSVDVLFMVDVYHELLYPREVMQKVVESLKPGGRVILIEYRGEDKDVPIKALHKTTQEQLKKELAAVGLSWKETKDFLPWQHFIVFTVVSSQ